MCHKEIDFTLTLLDSVRIREGLSNYRDIAEYAKKYHNYTILFFIKTLKFKEVFQCFFNFSGLKLGFLIFLLIITKLLKLLIFFIRKFKF